MIDLLIALPLALLFLLVNLAVLFPLPELEPVKPAIDFYQENQHNIGIALVIFYLMLYAVARLRYAHLVVEKEELESQPIRSARGERCDTATYKLLDDNKLLHDENEMLKRQVRELSHSSGEAMDKLDLYIEKVYDMQVALSDADKRYSAIEEQLNKKDKEPSINAGVLSLLSLLQSKGRLLDFLMDDITSFDDDQIGRAARVVHQGCKSVLDEYFEISHVHSGQEGDNICIDVNYPTDHYRLVGRVSGQPPFHGRILHQGWKTLKVSLPRIITEDDSNNELSSMIISPSEVEIR